MQLILNTQHRTLRDAHGQPYEFGRYYSLPDAEGHRFIVHPVSNAYLIEIRKGKAKVQTARIRRLSTAGGRRTTGETRQQPLIAINLDPAQTIFPIQELIEAMMTTGIPHWQITAMFDDQFSDCVASDCLPHMASDGEVWREVLDANPHADLVERTHFYIESCRWAILHYEGRISHIYLWPEAREDAESILTALRQIQADEWAPSYV